MRTYYDVLGVAPDTPDVVIKAAYRALAKEYHPDGSSVAPDSAERFIEIQTAYAVLSKPQSRTEYDAELRDVLAQPALAAAGPANGAMPVAPWQPPPQASLEIERICARLALYSEPLAQSFHAAYLRGECRDEPARFAEEMEKSFFAEYFGPDPDVQALARLLLLGGRTNAAFTLNQLMAGEANPASKNLRIVLPMMLQKHFQDDALFVDWLRTKFGLTSAGGQESGGAEVMEARAASAVPPGAAAAAQQARHAKRAQPTTVLRSIVLVIMWAAALYFALFAALPVLQ